MKTNLQNIRNIYQFLEEYTRTKSKRNGRVRSLKDDQPWLIKCSKSYPSSSMIILLRFLRMI